MAARYELWAAAESGDIYAIRLEGECVTGCSGPLSLLEVAAARLSERSYEKRPEEILKIVEGWLGEAGPSREPVRRTFFELTMRRVAARRRQRR